MTDDVFNALGGGLTGMPNMDDDSEQGSITPEELKKQMNSLGSDDDTEDKTPTKDVEVKTSKKAKVDDEDDDTVTDMTSKSEKDPVKKDDVSDLEDEGIEIDDENIPVVVEYFSDKFAEELGWEFAEGEKPNSIEGLVKYMQGIIEVNSQPKYANEEIRDLDEYVAKGGNIKTYFESVYSTSIDLDKVDLSKESNQKAIIKENLRSKGYSDTRIEKLITRYEETDALEEEAQDSLEEVKEIRLAKKQELIEEQRKQEAAYKEQQKQFVSNVEKIIKETNEIAGVKVTEADRKELMEYIFKPTSDGMTQYQKDYNSNLKNLVDSAFFTKKGDKFVQQIEKKAATTATRKLTLKLKTSGKSTKNTASDMDNGGKVSKLWDIASSAIRSFE